MNPPAQDWSEVCEHVITVQYTPVLQKLKESRPLESLVTDDFFREWITLRKYHCQTGGLSRLSMTAFTMMHNGIAPERLADFLSSVGSGSKFSKAFACLSSSRHGV